MLLSALIGISAAYAVVKGEHTRMGEWISWAIAGSAVIGLILVVFLACLAVVTVAQ